MVYNMFFLDHNFLSGRLRVSLYTKT